MAPRPWTPDATRGGARRTPPEAARRSVVDSAVHRHGRRAASPATLTEAFRRLREKPVAPAHW
ncbi:hypothetical protein [Streptomyces sp. enrichment culture]|uniref:hypothetical protein n=1 Tax=Streptomyces sp. enrichment culture TaxID=1795815 RepID=UPI003F56AF60